MGGKFEIRFNVDDDEFFSYQTEYTNSFIQFLKCLFKNRGKIIYFVVRP